MPFFIVNNATRKGEKIMKRITNLLLIVTMMLAITLTISVIPTEKDAAIYEDTLRLHILANSDSESDQALKYRIRDKLLTKYGALLSTAESPDGAKEKIINLADEIERDVEEWISDEGYNYGCSITIGTEWYDTREYEAFTLPKGYYTSLRVMLGDAGGQNWWCVMYPPLCLDIASEETPEDDAVSGYTDEEYSLVTNGGYRVRFKLLELFSGAFSKNG